jgi:hypothetical protein
MLKKRKYELVDFWKDVNTLMSVLPFNLGPALTLALTRDYVGLRYTHFVTASFHGYMTSVYKL